MVASEEEAVAALPAILSYDRPAVRQRFEEKFTATRMAKDYVGLYYQLLMTRTSSTRPRQLAVNGGNGLAPVSIEEPIPALFEAGTRLKKSHNPKPGDQPHAGDSVISSALGSFVIAKWCE